MQTLTPKTPSWMTGFLWSLIADAIVLALFYKVLVSNPDDVLPMFLQKYYVESFVVLGLVFFFVGFLLIITNNNLLKRLNARLKTWSKWRMILIFLGLGTLHFIPYIMLSFAGVITEPGDIYFNHPAMWVLISGVVGFIILATILIGDETEFQLKGETIQKIYTKHPILLSLLYAWSALTLPMMTLGVFLWNAKTLSLRAGNILKTIRKPLTHILQLIFGLFVAMTLAFEVHIARFGSELDILNLFTPIFWRVLIIALFFYLPFKLFTLLADKSQNYRLELMKGLVVIAAEVALIYLVL